MFTKYFIVFVLALSVASSDLTINVFNANDETALLSLNDCNPTACDQLCRRLGFPGGACVGDKCDCDNFKQNAVNTFKAVDGCNYQACDQLCRRLGFPGGACVGDKCKCDNFKQIQSIKDYLEQSANKYRKHKEHNENDVVSNDEDGTIITRNCDILSCINACRNAHFAGGMCVGGYCQCY